MGTKFNIGELQTKFHVIYANLPLGVRNEIIAVVNKEPMTRRVVRIEVMGERITTIGKQALISMKKMEIL